jgi:hypothetical protein
MRNRYFSAVPVAHPDTDRDRCARADYLCRWHTPAPSYRYLAAEARSFWTRLNEDLSDSRYRGLVFGMLCHASGGVPVAHPGKVTHREKRGNDRHLCRWHRSEVSWQ